MSNVKVKGGMCHLTFLVLIQCTCVLVYFQVLNAVPDQDTFYDVTDCLEELGMERITHRHMNRKGADLDLLTQFNLYEVYTCFYLFYI